MIKGADKQPKREFLQSAVLSFHAELKSSMLAEGYPTQIQIQAVGVTYGPQEATVDDIYADELTLSVAMMRTEREDLATEVDRQARLTEQVAVTVGMLAANLARAAGESGDGAGNGARDRAKEQFFSRIDDPFRAWLAQVDGRLSALEVGQMWASELRRYATELGEQLVASASSSAIIGRDTGWGFMNVSIAENFFRSALQKLVPNPDNKQEGMK